MAVVWSGTIERSRSAEVPRPTHLESSPEAVEALALALEAVGKDKLAKKVRHHASGFFRLFECAAGHVTARPDSDGNHLCPWCRWRRLSRWLRNSLLGKVQPQAVAALVLRFPAQLDPRPVRDRLMPLLKGGGRAVFDFRPIGSAAWEAVVVAVFPSDPPVEEVARALTTPGSVPAVEAVPIEKLDVVLDRWMPRLSDFAVHELAAYLRVDFGVRVMRGRAARLGRPEQGHAADGHQTDSQLKLHPEVGPVSNLEQAAEEFQERLAAIMSGRRTDGHGADPTPAADYKAAAASPASASPSSTARSEAAPVDTPQQRDGQLSPRGPVAAMPPPGFRLISLRPADAVRIGPKCPLCGAPTVELGLYRLQGEQLVRVEGSGAERVMADRVGDPTGELRVRAVREYRAAAA